MAGAHQTLPCSSPDRRWGWRRGLLLLLAAQGMSFAAFGVALDGELLFDDVPLLVDNDCHRSLKRVSEILDLSSGSICGHRPLRTLSFALDHAIWGSDHPFGYHLTNLLLHGFAGWLAAFAVGRFSGRRSLGLLAAGLWLLHPICSEAVAYISGRRDLLMAIFALAAWIGYLSYTERGGWGRAILSCVALVAAFLSHELAVAVAPAVLILEIGRGVAAARGDGRLGALAAWRAGLRWVCQPRRGRLLAAWIGLVVVLALWGAAWRNSATRSELWGPNLGAHVGTVARVHAHYLRQLTIPVQLIADYAPRAFPVSISLISGAALAACGLLVAMLGGACLWLARAPLVAAAGLAYFALLVPASQIVIHHELLAEHRLYLPALCFCALVAAGLARIRVRWPRTALVLTLALGAAYGLQSAVRSLDWTSAERLWRVTVAQVPQNARARANLGAVLAAKGRLADAEPHLRRALQIDPGLCDARFNLGKLRVDQGRRREGLAEIDAAVRCKPTPGLCLQAGEIALAARRWALAERYFRGGLARAPRHARLLFGLGTALHRGGDHDGAAEAYARALRERPRWPKLVYRAALVAGEQCRVKRAAALLERLRGVWRDPSPETERLGALLRGCRDRGRGVEGKGP